MAYESGFLKYRVTIKNKTAAAGFGDTTSYRVAGEVWANIAFTKGIKAMHEGALDAYDTVMIRMRYTDLVSRDSHLVHDGVEYQILSFHRDFQDNTIQVTACELVQNSATPAENGGNEYIKH